MKWKEGKKVIQILEERNIYIDIRKHVMKWKDNKKESQIRRQTSKKYSILEGILLNGQPNDVIAQYNETAQKMWGENFFVIKTINKVDISVKGQFICHKPWLT